MPQQDKCPLRLLLHNRCLFTLSSLTRSPEKCPNGVIHAVEIRGSSVLRAIRGVPVRTAHPWRPELWPTPVDIAPADAAAGA
ncbi:hypothetical protein VTJ04DRAFT_4422 [Mycothermus thermophilus]|uniref:uncharacterized protein n=1 Tax=Humicola insolens TaxID=85995 RepID=UPI003744697C